MILSAHKSHIDKFCLICESIPYCSFTTFHSGWHFAVRFINATSQEADMAKLNKGETAVLGLFAFTAEQFAQMCRVFKIKLPNQYQGRNVHRLLDRMAEKGYFEVRQNKTHDRVYTLTVGALGWVEHVASERDTPEFIQQVIEESETELAFAHRLLRPAALRRPVHQRHNR